jgi:hypothetical protein
MIVRSGNRARGVGRLLVSQVERLAIGRPVSTAARA